MAASRRELLRLLDKLEGPVAREFREAVARMRSRAQIAALTAAIEAGDVDAAIRALGMRPGTWSGLSESVRSAYVEAGIFVMSADVPTRFGMEFNVTNPRAERWLREHSSEFITYITAEQRDTVQQMLFAGQMAGRNPRSTALDIVGRMSRQTGRRQGGIIGLNRPQAAAALHMRESLGSPLGVGVDRINDQGKPVKTFWIGNDGHLKSTFKLRDRRFDSIVRKAIEADKPLTQASINRLVGRYEDRLLKLRGDTVGRTEALASMNEASDESLRQVIDEGLAPPDAVKRIWRHSFSKNERPGHLEMSGQERGVDEPFTNPNTGAMLMHPGEGPASETINCRCIVEHKISYVDIELAA